MEEKNQKNGLIVGFAVAGIISMIFVVASTLYGELHAPFKNWLAQTFSHHWVGKGVIASLIFVFGGVLFSPLFNRKGAVAFALWGVVWVALIGSFVILGFYLYEFFLNH
ncbi:MAG: hypothetical protein ACE5F4_02770 [Candidatus Paceibacteria bacterium]